MGVAAVPGPPSCSLLAIGTPEGRQPQDHVVLGSLCLIPEQRFLSPGFQSRGVAGAWPGLMVHHDWLSPRCHWHTDRLSFFHWDKEP